MSGTDTSDNEGEVSEEAEASQLPRLYNVDEAIERIRALTQCAELPLGRRKFSELARVNGCYRVWRKIYVTDEQITTIVEALQFRGGSYNQVPHTGVLKKKPLPPFAGVSKEEAIKLAQKYAPKRPRRQP